MREIINFTFEIEDDGTISTFKDYSLHWGHGTIGNAVDSVVEALLEATAPTPAQEVGDE